MSYDPASLVTCPHGKERGKLSGAPLGVHHRQEEGGLRADGLISRMLQVVAFHKAPIDLILQPLQATPSKATAEQGEQFPLDPDVPGQQSEQFPLDPEAQPTATKGRKRKVSMLSSKTAGTHKSRPCASVTIRLDPWQPVPCGRRRSRLPLTNCGPLQPNLSEHLENGTGSGSGSSRGIGPQLSFRNWLPGKESVKVSCRLLYPPLGLDYLSGSQAVEGYWTHALHACAPAFSPCCPARG